jgi:hypothetical protein
MNKFIKVAVFVAVGVAASAAFASGYGPAPHYDPLQGAPASQQGPGVAVVSAQAVNDQDMTGVGGMADTMAQWGSHMVENGFFSTFKHH